MEFYHHNYTAKPLLTLCLNWLWRLRFIEACYNFGLRPVQGLHFNKRAYMYIKEFLRICGQSFYSFNIKSIYFWILYKIKSFVFKVSYDNPYNYFTSLFNHLSNTKLDKWLKKYHMISNDGIYIIIYCFAILQV